VVSADKVNPRRQDVTRGIGDAVRARLGAVGQGRQGQLRVPMLGHEPVDAVASAPGRTARRRFRALARERRTGSASHRGAWVAPMRRRLCLARLAG
jgi:hypothetical protein